MLDVDGLWLPSGEVVDPGPIFHVGHIAEVIRAQNFGTAVNERWSEPGQIWITDAMARQFGIETGALGDDPRKRAEEMRSLTAGIPFVTEALEEGWSLGGKLGDRLGTLDAGMAWRRARRLGSVRLRHGPGRVGHADPR